MSYIVNLPEGMYDWDFDHTGPEGVEIVYVTTPSVDTKKAYILYKSKKPNRNK